MKDFFPIFKHHPHLVYLDSAATTHKPETVLSAMQQFYSHDYATVNRAVYQLARKATDQCHAVRVKVKEFIGAKHEEEIIFTRGTTSSLNLVARSFGKAFLSEGDEVLISQTEHHSNIVPWQIVCEEKKAKLRVIPTDEHGNLLLSEYKKLLSHKVKIVSIAHISNTLGVIHPIKEMVLLAHHFNAKVCVDGAQSISHLPIDVQELDVDFFAFSGHKMYGPTGIGVLYGKRDLLDQMPPVEGGGDMIEKVTFEKTVYQKLPFKFEAGTPMIAEIIGLGSAIDFLKAYQLNAIYHKEGELLKFALKELYTMPRVKVFGNQQDRGALTSFVVEGIHPLDLMTLLDCKQIALRSGHLCSQPTLELLKVPSLLRLSIGIYNDNSDIEKFITHLKNLIKFN